MRRSADALLSVINDILDFSKVEAGKMTIESLAFDLRVAMEEVNEMLAPRAHEKNIDLVLEYPESLPRYFIGDAGRIRQVVTNLVGNAVKFTPGGQVLVMVACDSAGAEDANLRISVEDSGPGIAAEKLALLFQKFSQGDNSASRKHGGTGLGLQHIRLENQHDLEGVVLPRPTHTGHALLISSTRSASSHHRARPYGR